MFTPMAPKTILKLISIPFYLVINLKVFFGGGLQLLAIQLIQLLQ